MKKRVIVYIDGYNLYFGMCAVFKEVQQAIDASQCHQRYKWLNIQSLSDSLLSSGEELVFVNYFTSIATRDRDAGKRQELYIKALRAHCDKLKVYNGKMIKDPQKCPHCEKKYNNYKEKKTDISLACRILRDAHLDSYDCFYLVSGDIDFIPVLEMIKNDYPEKERVIVYPPKRNHKNDELGEYANRCFTIDYQEIARNQLPDTVIPAKGKPLTRPPAWR